MGDIAKVHIKGSYYAQRPLFRLCNKDYFLKQRKVDFLNTHFIGETAFVSVHIGNSSKNAFNDEDGYGLGKLVRVAGRVWHLVRPQFSRATMLQRH